MNSKAFIVFLIVTTLVSVGLVLFFAKRHPHPRFRPKRGEIVLVSIFLGFLSVGISFFMSQLFEHDWDLQKKPTNPLEAWGGSSGEGEGPDARRDRGGAEPGGSSDDESLPPFLRGDDK